MISDLIVNAPQCNGGSAEIWVDFDVDDAFYAQHNLDPKEIPKESFSVLVEHTYRNGITTYTLLNGGCPISVNSTEIVELSGIEAKQIKHVLDTEVPDWMERVGEKVDEWCSHCNGQAEVRWDGSLKGLKQECPLCHKTMMLCSVCPDLHDRGICDWINEGGCIHNPTSQATEVV